MKEHFIEVSQEAGAALFARNIPGEVVMLNMLRFRNEADYSANPELMPSDPISGAEAYQRYMDCTLPFLTRISHQFRWCQVQNFLQQTLVGYVCCKNTAEDGAAWTDLW